MLFECAQFHYDQYIVHYIQGGDIKYIIQSLAGATLSRIHLYQTFFESLISYLFACATDIDVNSDVVFWLVLTLLSQSFRSFRHYPK